MGGRGSISKLGCRREKCGLRLWNATKDLPRLSIRAGVEGGMRRGHGADRPLG